MNKFKHGSLLIIAALGLSACSVSVTDSDDYWRHSKDTKKIICEMVDKDALKNPEQCEERNQN